MKQSALIADFHNLGPPNVEDSIQAIAIHETREDFLGKAKDGTPVFLFSESQQNQYRPPIQHKHLSISFGTSCRLVVRGRTIESTFTLVRFEGDDFDFHEMFISSVGASMATLPRRATAADMEQRLKRLLEVFRCLSLPSRRELVGLWAELLCIKHSPSPLRALSYWHASINDKFDFSWANGCAEVKATTNSFRIHEFSLEQLQSSTAGYLVSIQVQASNGGKGIVNLAQEICDLIPFENTQLVDKLWSQIFLTMGEELTRTVDKKFDEGYSLKTLEIFELSTIPIVDRKNDSRISAVRFKVDLTSLEVTIAGDAEKKLLEVFPPSA